MFTLSPVSLFPSIAFSTVLGPSHYSVKPHYIHYKQFQIQKLHVHLDDVDKKNYYIPRAYSARGYDVRALCVRHAVSQSRIWTFILLKPDLRILPQQRLTQPNTVILIIIIIIIRTCNIKILHLLCKTNQPESFSTLETILHLDQIFTKESITYYYYCPLPYEPFILT